MTLLYKEKRTSKEQLTAALAKAAGVSEVEADFYYEVFVDEIMKRLKKGNDVVLAGVGKITFTKASSKISNFTGQIIPPHKRLRFIPDVHLAMHVKKSTREYPIK